MSESDVVVNQQDSEVLMADEKQSENPTEVNNDTVHEEEQNQGSQVETESNLVKENEPVQIEPHRESEVVVENLAEQPFVDVTLPVQEAIAPVEGNEVKEEQKEETREETREESQPTTTTEVQPVAQEVREEPRVEIKEESQPVTEERKEETHPAAEVKQPEPARELKEYSLEEVARHDKPDDCWIIINNKVYDVTPFVSQHPGGVAVLRNVGKDSTEGFDKIGAHKKKAKPEDELSKAQNWMPTFLIGTVRPSANTAETTETKEADPEDILGQCLAEVEEKVKTETARAEPSASNVQPIAVQSTPTVSTSVQQTQQQQPQTKVQPTTSQPKVQPTTSQSKVQPTTTTKVTETSKSRNQPSSEASYTTWFLVAGGVAVAAVGAYAYYTKKQNA